MDAYEKQIAEILCALGISEKYRDRKPFLEATELASIGLDIYGREQKLVPNAATAWQKMKAAAENDGAKLLAVSAFRSIAYQRQIIERKLTAGQTMEQILRVSAAPGFSEHHTGRAIDITAPNCKPLTEEFERTPEFHWLSRRAKEFGFMMSYPRDNKFGVIYEPWHWTFHDSNIAYNEIATDYAAHRRVHPILLRKLIEFPLLTPESRVLEVGSGTGNYIAAIASATSAKSFGVEPSEKMLEEAFKKSASVSFQRGAADLLPYSNDYFDLIFSTDVIHHIPDKAAFFKEAFRTLKSGGWFATATDTEKIICERMPLSHYFPETIEVELRRYPKDGEIEWLLSDQKFTRISKEFVEFTCSLSDSTAFERKAFSSLHLISDEAFTRGLNRFKQDLKKGQIASVSRYVIYWGRKP